MSLAQELQGAMAKRAETIAKERNSMGHVHRIGTPEEQLEKPTVPRKKKDAAPTIDEAAVKGKRRKKRKYTKRAGALSVLQRESAGTGVTYAVNESGAITIAKLGEDGIDLDLADTKRLAVFMERTSTLRK